MAISKSNVKNFLPPQSSATITHRKPRVSKACANCRTRKIKCRFKHEGACTNCKRSKVQCIKNTKEIKRGDSRLDGTRVPPEKNHPTEHGNPIVPTELAHTVNLPDFIKPLPKSIGPHEIIYLENKGALTIPSVGLRIELLGAYIEQVHPSMPLLELNDVSMIVESGSAALSRISLILFQAVMFAGSTRVHTRHLQKAGYKSRQEAQNDFLQKTKLLFDCNYESDSVTLVQVLLLLMKNDEDSWHWMGNATSIAYKGGLHRNPEKFNGMDAKTAKLRKRIWWSIYTQDYRIALAMNRPTLIKPEDFDVTMLTLDDFENLSCVSTDCHVARDIDIDEWKTWAASFIQNAKFTVWMTATFSSRYEVSLDPADLVRFHLAAVRHLLHINAHNLEVTAALEAVIQNADIRFGPSPQLTCITPDNILLRALTPTEELSEVQLPHPPPPLKSPDSETLENEGDIQGYFDTFLNFDDQE